MAIFHDFSPTIHGLYTNFDYHQDQYHAFTGSVTPWAKEGLFKRMTRYQKMAVGLMMLYKVKRMVLQIVFLTCIIDYHWIDKW